MKVDVSHHVDASEPDDKGCHAYHYEYDILTFSDSTTWYTARAYSDTPHAASFMTSDSHALTAQDLRDPLFVEAAAYLRTIGKTELSWFSVTEGRYVPLVSPGSNDQATSGNAG